MYECERNFNKAYMQGFLKVKHFHSHIGEFTVTIKLAKRVHCTLSSDKNVYIRLAEVSSQGGIKVVAFG